MDWRGFRVTLGCGHMELRDKAPAIGVAAACYVCPVRRRESGGQVSALRQIVNVEEVTAPREPELIDSIWWYWEGDGR